MALKIVRGRPTWAPGSPGAGRSARRSTRHTVPVSEVEDRSAGIWRPLTVRGVPLHFVLPAAIGVIGVTMLAAGGLTAVLGAWILTIGFSLAVGAFVVDPRALAVPAIVWAGWVIVGAVAGEGSGLPRTPLGLAVVLAGLGAACVWLGQRAVQPAVEGARVQERERLETDIDALLEPVQAPDASPSLDPSAEVDDALAALLLDDDAELAEDVADEPQAEAEAETDEPQAEAEAEPVEESGPGAKEPEPAAMDAKPAPDNEQPEAEPEPDDDPTGHVIEFEALNEDDLADDDAPLPAATEAGRRGERS